MGYAITSILNDWVEEKRRAQLREAIIIGCKEMTEIYIDHERIYHPLEEEVERSSTDTP